MAKYVLEPLLDIRKKREDELTQQLVKARNDLQAAEDARDKAKQELEDYVAEMPENGNGWFWQKSWTKRNRMSCKRVKRLSRHKKTCWRLPKTR